MKPNTTEATEYIAADKTTDELNHEIKAATDIEDYLRKNSGNMLSHSLSECLNRLLSQKGITRADVVRGSLLDRAYVYQIFSGEKTPSRDKLIAIAFGLNLSYEETQRMLKLSGNRELYSRDERDALIMFSLQRGMTIFETNELLIDHCSAILGVPNE